MTRTLVSDRELKENSEMKFGDEFLATKLFNPERAEGDDVYTRAEKLFAQYR